MASSFGAVVAQVDRRACHSRKTQKNTFENKHFGCLRTPGICCFALCCPGIQWADTVNLAGLPCDEQRKLFSGYSYAGFCIALPLFFFCALVNGLIFGGIVCYGICTSLLILYYRQYIREQLGLKSWSCPGCCFDILYVFICPCCAIVQEAQVVRLALERSVAAVSTPAVGNPPASAPSPKSAPSPTNQTAGRALAPTSRGFGGYSGERAAYQPRLPAQLPPTSGFSDREVVTGPARPYVQTQDLRAAVSAPAPQPYSGGSVERRLSPDRITTMYR